MEALYEKKYSNHRIIYFLAFIICVILNIIVTYAKMPSLNVLYSMVALCSMSYLIYNTHGKNVIINSAIVIIYIAITDLIVTTIFSIFTLNNTYNALQKPEFYLISGLASAVVILCTNNLLIQLILRCQISKVSLVLNSYMIYLMIFEVSCLCYFLVQDYEHNIPLLLISLGFIVVDGGIIYLYKLISKNALLEKQTELLERQREMTVKYYDGLQKRYEQTQKLLHDMKKHIQVISCLASSEESLKEEYSKELINSMDEIGWQFQCSDKIVSAIVWDKIQVCKNQNITFEVNMQDIDFDFMDKIDVTTLFANLLDNAIEACQCSKEQKRKITLRIHRYKDYIVIMMRNTIGGIPVLKDGRLMSTKAEHMGMGMIILENLVNKYCGNLSYGYSNEFFETKITIAII